MPFTVNVGPYQGGNFLFQGLSNLGQGIGGGIASATELRRKQQEEQGQSDTIFDEYLKSKKFSDDPTANKEMAAKEALKFHDLSPSAKKGVAAGIIQNWLQGYHVEQIKNMQSEAAARKAQVDIARAAQTFTPPTEDVQQITKMGGAMVATSPGHFEVVGVPARTKPGYTPSEEARKDAQEKGFDYFQTAPDNYVLRELPKQAKAPDDAKLGEDGNPILTPDGSMYFTKSGKVKPATEGMASARQIYEATKPKADQPSQGLLKSLIEQAGRPDRPIAPNEADVIFGGATPAPAATARPSATPSGDKRAQAVAALQAKGYPTTEANIKALMGQMK